MSFPRSMHLDMLRLIQEVEKRKSLWANKHKSDRFRRAQDWMDLVRTLFSNEWDTWSKAEKDGMISYAQSKWRSIRDNIVKQIRRQEMTKLGCPQQRKASYMYFDRCSFILPEIPAHGKSFVWTKMNKHAQSIQMKKDKKPVLKQEVGTSSSEEEVEVEPNDPLASPGNSSSDSDDEPLKKAARPDTKPPAKEIEYPITRFRRIAPAAIKTVPLSAESPSAASTSAHVPSCSPSTAKPYASDAMVMDADEAFFRSIMPTVQKLTDEQKMEFRIAVMKLLKSLKQTPTNATNPFAEEFFMM